MRVSLAIVSSRHTGDNKKESLVQGMSSEAGPSVSSFDRAVLRRLIAAHARNTVSVQLDHGNFQCFVAPDEAGALAFQVRAGVAIVAGEPACRPGDTLAVVEAFLASRARRSGRAIFVSASRAFADYMADLDCSAIKVGEEAIFDLDRHSFTGGAMKRLRYHEKRARRHGVSVAVLSATDDMAHRLAGDLNALTTTWLRRKTLGPCGFLLATRPLWETHHHGKRVYVALQHGRPIAYLTGVPIPAAGGVYFEDYVYTPDAPDGTIEALFHEASDDVRARGFGFATFGTAPLARLTSADFASHPMTGVCLRTLFRYVSWPYSFRSLYRFKARFHPTRWAAKYLVYERPFTLRSAAALALAYAPDVATRGRALLDSRATRWAGAAVGRDPASAPVPVPTGRR